MKYKLTYLPKNKLTRAGGPKGVLMVYGGTYELDQEQAEDIIRRIPGENGRECLVKAGEPVAKPDPIAETPAAPAPKADKAKGKASEPVAKPGPGETET